MLGVWSGSCIASSVLFLAFYTAFTVADDRFTCCMGGWKSMRGVTLCPARCCLGYEERKLEMPLLQYPVVCHKLNEEEMLQREEEMKKLETERAMKKQKEKEKQMRKDELQKLHQQQRFSQNSLSKAMEAGYMEDEIKSQRRMGQWAVDYSRTPNYNSVHNSIDTRGGKPRRDTRGSGEFEDFLLQNSQFFRDLLFQGYTPKDLITSLEKFLAAQF